MAKVSIVIPHHNSSTLIERLLKSIPQSDFYQTIVVDDHSTDLEYSALQELKKKYSFELYKNGGKYAGGARNTGLKYVLCEFVIFLDADDFVVLDFDSLIKKHINTTADVVYFNVSSCYSDTLEPAYRHEHIASLFSRYKCDGDEDLFRCCYLSPVAKLIRTDLVRRNNIQFEEIPAGNDMWFSANTGVLASKIEIDPSVLYMITVSEGSITTTLSKDNFESRLQATIKTNRFLCESAKNNYQISILYFLGKAYQFGFLYFIHVVAVCYKARVNPFVGAKKLFKINKVLQDRQNQNVMKRM